MQKTTNIKNTLKHKVRILKSDGLTPRQISNQLGCTIENVYYHLKHKYKVLSGSNPDHPYSLKGCSFRQTNKKPPRSVRTKSSDSKAFYDKIRGFHRGRKKGVYEVQKATFTLQDIINKHTETPKCYLTGDDINIHDTRNYQFDHVIPVSKGGQNTLDNLGICTSEANRAKQDMTPDQFYNLCKKILEHQGYEVTKKNG